MTRMDPVEFLDRLIQTRSPSFHERKVAELCESYLRQFSFEKVWIDEAGNAAAAN